MGTAKVNGKQYRSGKLPSGQKYEIQKYGKDRSKTAVSAVTSGSRRTSRVKVDGNVKEVTRTGKTPSGKNYLVGKINGLKHSRIEPTEQAPTHRRNTTTLGTKTRTKERHSDDYDTTKTLGRGKQVKSIQTEVHHTDGRDSFSQIQQRNAKKDGKLGKKVKKFVEYDGVGGSRTTRTKTFKDE